ncbi:MAG: hypothetical protein AAF206_32200, partial [Bacteroidota bacterium]
ILMLAVSCQHDTDTFDGPSLIDRFGEFELRDSLAASQDMVDFASGETVFFTASFSKRINWVVQITGKESGAVKNIEGFDNELNVGNATWNGTTSLLPFFKAEECEVSLIIPEEDSLTYSIDITVESPRVYEGNLVTDFETDPGSSVFQGNFEFELTSATGFASDIPAGEGNRYYLFEGTDDVVANFFVGLIRIFPSINGETYFSLPTSIPEQCYFNFFLYGDGAPNTIAVIQFFTDSNDNGTFDEGTDKSFQLEGDFPVTEIGWQAINHTMADVGISEEDLSKLVGIQVLLISNLNAQPNPPLEVRFGLDYLTFTQDQPLAL